MQVPDGLPQLCPPLGHAVHGFQSRKCSSLSYLQPNVCPDVTAGSGSIPIATSKVAPCYTTSMPGIFDTVYKLPILLRK